ncbi:MAG: hypothetical protein AB7I38_03990 [Dehalococcoidia bacterium]
MPATIRNLLPDLSSIEQYFDYLDRWAVGTVEELRERMSSRALAKALLIETSEHGGVDGALAAVRRSGSQLERIGDMAFRVRDPRDDGVWAIADFSSPRFPVLYTAVEAEQARIRLSAMVDETPGLDRCWFSSAFFRVIWNFVKETFPPHRYAQIVFNFQSAYERLLDVDDSTLDPSDLLTIDDASEYVHAEPRGTRIQIGERVGRLGRLLDQITPLYEPLESIVRLRLPAAEAGGHDFYFDGRVTNRSNSVVELRNNVELVRDVYAHSTRIMEEALWGADVDGVQIGAPLVIRFSEPLEQDTFVRWLDSLNRKNNRFRLWADPIRMSDQTAHLYAVDAHLRQPIDLQVSTGGILAMLPPGTCANTAHRLVTTVQQSLSPKVSSWIGTEPYEEFIVTGLRSALQLPDASNV